MSVIRGTYNNLCAVMGDPIYIRKEPLVEIEWRTTKFVHVGYLVISGTFSELTEEDHFSQMSWLAFNRIKGESKSLTVKMQAKIEEALLKACTAKELLLVKPGRNALFNEGKETYTKLMR